MSKEINTSLKEPFDGSVLGTLRKGGKNLTYVPGAEVIARLNNVLGTENWSIVEADAWRETSDPDWILARVKIEATISDQTTHKIQFGGQAINYKKDSNEPVDLGNDFKGAVTDAFKKAATQLGVGLDLARKEDALALEEQQAAPRADDDTIKEIADAISTLSAEKKKEFKQVFVENRIPPLASGDVTESDAALLKARVVELASEVSE